MRDDVNAKLLMPLRDGKTKSDSGTKSITIPLNKVKRHIPKKKYVHPSMPNKTKIDQQLGGKMSKFVTIQVNGDYESASVNSLFFGFH